MNREGRLKGWCVLFCFKYGEKQDGRDGIDGFRRPLHCGDSLLCHLSILFGKDGAELETWIGAFAYERKGAYN